VKLLQQESSLSWTQKAGGQRGGSGNGDGLPWDLDLD
jgi:hypothetical protein